MRGRIGRVPGLKTIYWTPDEKVQLRGAILAFMAIHPHRTLNSVSAFINRWANDESEEYRGADAD